MRHTPCLPMVQESRFQSLVESYQSLKKKKKKKKKEKKKVLDASLLNIRHYKVWIKEKWCDPGKGVMPFLLP